MRAIGGSFADRREKLHQIGLVEEKEAGDQAGLKKPGWPQKPGWTEVKRSSGQLSKIGRSDGLSLLRNVANIIFNTMEQTDHGGWG